jgi:hypothetical protein
MHPQMTSNLPQYWIRWSQNQDAQEEAVHGGKEGALANVLFQLEQFASMKGASKRLLQLQSHAER